MPLEFEDSNLKQPASYLQAELQEIHSRLDHSESPRDRIEADARMHYLDLHKQFNRQFKKFDERFEDVRSDVADFKARVRRVERKVLTEDEIFSE